MLRIVIPAEQNILQTIMHFLQQASSQLYLIYKFLIMPRYHYKSRSKSKSYHRDRPSRYEPSKNQRQDNYRHRQRPHPEVKVEIEFKRKKTNNSHSNRYRESRSKYSRSSYSSSSSSSRSSYSSSSESNSSESSDSRDHRRSSRRHSHYDSKEKDRHRYKKRSPSRERNHEHKQSNRKYDKYESRGTGHRNQYSKNQHHKLTSYSRDQSKRFSDKPYRHAHDEGGDKYEKKVQYHDRRGTQKNSEHKSFYQKHDHSKEQYTPVYKPVERKERDTNHPKFDHEKKENKKVYEIQVKIPTEPQKQSYHPPSQYHHHQHVPTKKFDRGNNFKTMKEELKGEPKFIKREKSVPKQPPAPPKQKVPQFKQILESAKSNLVLKPLQFNFLILDSYRSMNGIRSQTLDTILQGKLRSSLENDYQKEKNKIFSQQIVIKEQKQRQCVTIYQEPSQTQKSLCQNIETLKANTSVLSQMLRQLLLAD